MSHVGVAGRMGRDLEFIRSDAFAATCRTRPPDLTRRRKMPHDPLAGSVVARKGRTLSPGVRDLAREAHMAGPTGVPGYPRARERPGPEALLGLARHHAAGACADGDWRTHGGMPPVATCGPASDAPTNAETTPRWGSSSGHGRDRATMGLSGALDVVNRQMPGLAVRRGGFDERAEVPGHVGAVADAVGGLPFALVTGGGHPSLPLMATLSDMGVPNAARRRRGSTGAGSGACEAAGGDLRPGPGLTNPRLRSAGRSDRDAWERLVGHAPLRVRCALAGVGGEAPERLAATIGDDAPATGGHRRGLPHEVGRRDVPPVHEGPPADGEPRGHQAQAHRAGRLRRRLPRQRRVRPGQRGREGGLWRHRRAWA